MGCAAERITFSPTILRHGPHFGQKKKKKNLWKRVPFHIFFFFAKKQTNKQTCKISRSEVRNPLKMGPDLQQFFFLGGGVKSAIFPLTCVGVSDLGSHTQSKIIQVPPPKKIKHLWCYNANWVKTCKYWFSDKAN